MQDRRTIPLYERQQARKSLNAQVEERPSYRITTARPRSASYPRFGTKLAACLLILELSLLHPLDDFDIEWFEGELLRRLREHLVADSTFTEGQRGGFDLWAGMYDYAGTDIDCVLHLGKRRYQALLAEILASIYREEGAAGELTAKVLRAFRVPWTIAKAARRSGEKHARFSSRAVPREDRIDA